MGLDKEKFRNVELNSNIVRDVQEIRATVKEAMVDLNTLFTSIIGNLTSIPQPKSVLEMVKCYEQPCDALIVGAKRQEALHYVSGKLVLTMLDSRQFACAAELYFQDAAGKWVVKKTGSGPIAMSHLTLDAQAELQQAGKIAFEVLDPELS
jgi:hypothetical protein